MRQSTTITRSDDHHGHNTSSLLDRLLQPSLTSRSTFRIFRSKEGIRQECIRQRTINRYIIHPNSTFRWCWDLILLATFLVTFLTSPVEIAFYSIDKRGVAVRELYWTIPHIAGDVIFLVDVLFSFRSAFIGRTTEEVVLENRAIIPRYVRTWLMIDLAANVPFEYVYERFVPQGPQSRTVFIITVSLKLMVLLRVLRLPRLMPSFNRLTNMLQLEGYVVGMFDLVLVILLFCHWNACLQWLSAYLEHYPEFPNTSWVVIDNLQMDGITIWSKYSRALFRALSHMLCIGYGTIPPETLGEIWMVVISQTLGATFYALFIASLSGLVMSLDLSGRKYAEKLSEVKQYMLYRRVPKDVQKKVLEYYDHKYQGKYFDEFTILFESSLSKPIQQEIHMHICKKLVETVPFFSSAPQDFLYNVMCKLNHQVFLAGDYILQEGRKGDCMYFIKHGSVDVILPSGEVVNTLADGAFFGEISLLFAQRRVASVVAREACDVYQLTKQDFDEVLQDNPDMKGRLEIMAKERMSRIVPITAEGNGNVNQSTSLVNGYASVAGQGNVVENSRL